MRKSTSTVDDEYAVVEKLVDAARALLDLANRMQTEIEGTAPLGVDAISKIRLEVRDRRIEALEKRIKELEAVNRCTCYHAPEQHGDTGCLACDSCKATRLQMKEDYERSKKREEEKAQKKPFICGACKDTHSVYGFSCAGCPLPCSHCTLPSRPYCRTTPCSCGCHRYAPWYTYVWQKK